MINTIIFDFGKVLGTDPYVVFCKALSKYGISKEIAREILGKHWFKLKIGEENADKLWSTVEGYNPAEINNIILEFNNLISVDDDMIDLCRELKDKGYKLGILANEGLEWMEIKREKGKLKEIFDIIYSSADIKIPKPEEGAYLRILKDLGSEPSETLFIDDLERNTSAAEKLGIKSFIFTGIDKLREDLKNLNIL